MKMTVIFNEKKGVINLTSHNVVIEDFKSHICKRLKINPLDYKLKIDFLNNSIEPLLISAKSEKMNMEKQDSQKKSKTTYVDVNLTLIENLFSDCLFDFSPEHINDLRTNKLKSKLDVIKMSSDKEIKALPKLYELLFELDCIELKFHNGFYYAKRPYHETIEVYKNYETEKRLKTIEQLLKDKDLNITKVFISIQNGTNISFKIISFRFITTRTR